MKVRFGHLQRSEDVSGVSGTGRVAEWVEFSDGSVAARFLGDMASTNNYKSLEDLEKIHGHGGSTQVVVDHEEKHVNPQDAILKALTPGDLFNPKGKIWRSIKALSQFAGVDVPETLSTIDGSLASMVTIKPSAKGLLVALNEHIPAEESQQVVVVGGNAVGAPQQQDNPVTTAEMVDNLGMMADSPEMEDEALEEE